MAHRLRFILSTMAISRWKGQEVSSMRRDVSAVRQVPEAWRIPRSWWSLVYIGILKKWVLSPAKERLSNTIDELASESEGQTGKNKSLSSGSSHVGGYRKVWPRYRADLPILNGPIKKFPHRSAKLLGFWLISDVVKLPTNIHHNSQQIPTPSMLNSVIVENGICLKPIQFSFKLFLTYNTWHNINAVWICLTSYCLGDNNIKKPVDNIHAVHFKKYFPP